MQLSSLSPTETTVHMRLQADTPTLLVVCMWTPCLLLSCVP